MGNKTGIFDPETIRTISISGLGQISPNRHNQMTAHCRQCQTAIAPEAGYAFRAERYARLHSGYLCQTCIGDLLKSIHGWFFNKYFEILQPVVFDAPRSVDGDDLATRWIAGGINALFERVTTSISTE
jgi:hypothetical protein